MARDDRSATVDLTSVPEEVRALLGQARQYDFFQLMEVLSRLYPDRPEPGWGLHFPSEIVRVRAWPSAARSPSDIRSLTIVPGPGGRPELEMEIAFLGLYGLGSPTPTYFWDYIDEHPDSALRSLLDIFNTRAVGLFFRAWKRYRWHRSRRPGLRDAMTRRVFCLLGLGTERAPERPDLASDRLDGETTLLVEHGALDSLGDRMRLLAYAGLLATRTRPVGSLRRLLWDYFEGPSDERAEFLAIEENVLSWAYLSEGDWSRLGAQNSRMSPGRHVVAGTRVRDRRGSFRLHVGPLGWSRFLDFLPGGTSFARLVRLTRLASPFGTNFDVELRVRPEDVRGSELGREARLGWTSWIGDSPRAEPRRVRLGTRDRNGATAAKVAASQGSTPGRRSAR